MTTSCINATRLRDAIRTWVGTHKCANILEALLELLLGAKQPCPTLLLLLPPTRFAIASLTEVADATMNEVADNPRPGSVPASQSALERPRWRFDLGSALMSAATLFCIAAVAE